MLNAIVKYVKVLFGSINTFRLCINKLLNLFHHSNRLTGLFNNILCNSFNWLSTLSTFLCKLLNLSCNDCKAFTRNTCSCCFDRGIKWKQICLRCNINNQFNCCINLLYSFICCINLILYFRDQFNCRVSVCDYCINCFSSNFFSISHLLRIIRKRFNIFEYLINVITHLHSILVYSLYILSKSRSCRSELFHCSWDLSCTWAA